MSSPPDDNDAPASPPESLPNPKPSLTTPDGRLVMRPASRRLKNGLGFLHLILPLLLIYMLFKVWPPHEWPRATDEVAAATSASPSPTATATATPATTATTATPTQTPAQGAGTTTTGATASPTRQPTPTTQPATTQTQPSGAATTSQSQVDALIEQIKQVQRVASEVANLQKAAPNNNQSKLDVDYISFFTWLEKDEYKDKCEYKSTAKVVSPTGDNSLNRWFQCGIRVKTSIDERFLLLVIVAGALGSYIHAATSYADFLGNRKFTPSWTWWYLLRTLIGTALALVVYFAIRGGFLLLANDVESDKVNPYGIAAIAALVGMFSKQATDKLNELFSTLFRPKEGSGDDKRKDSLNEEGTAISPNRAAIGSGTISLIVTGNNFVGPGKSVVRISKNPKTGQPETPKTDKSQAQDTSQSETPKPPAPNYQELPTQFKSANQLIADLDMNQERKPGTYLVWVFTPPPGGGATTPVEFEVFEGDDAT